MYFLKLSDFKRLSNRIELKNELNMMYLGDEDDKSKRISYKKFNSF